MLDTRSLCAYESVAVWSITLWSSTRCTNIESCFSALTSGVFCEIKYRINIKINKCRDIDHLIRGDVTGMTYLNIVCYVTCEMKSTRIIKLEFTSERWLIEIIEWHQSFIEIENTFSQAFYQFTRPLSLISNHKNDLGPFYGKHASHYWMEWKKSGFNSEIYRFMANSLDCRLTQLILRWVLLADPSFETNNVHHISQKVRQI